MRLQCANEDVALCLSARFGPQTIALNTMQGGAWGEEAHLPIGPLSPHAECDLTIRIKKDKFLIGLNGHLHGEFAHRMPRELIERYDVSGLELSSVRFPKRVDLAGAAEAKKPKKSARDDDHDSVRVALRHLHARPRCGAVPLQTSGALAEGLAA